MSELMAMLAAGSPPITSVRGSQKSISPSDVAACLHTCNRFTYLFGLAKFSLDNSSKTELNWLAIQAARKHTFKRTESESKRVIDLLALVALRLAISPNKCPRCKGVGVIKSKSEFITCPSCNGEGIKKLSVMNLSKVINVSEWRARKIWQQRLTILLSDYAVMESDIQDSIYRGLRE